MVASGMTGIDDSFSGEHNFFLAFGLGPKTKPEALVRELGKTFEVVNTNIKRWTVGSPMQAPLDSVSYLIKQEKIKADDVEKVVVRIWPGGAATVNNRNMPDINLQYMVSVMLLDGTATLEAAHDFKRMNDPRVLELRKRVQLIADEELEKLLPSKPGIVEITLKDGRVLRHRTDDVRGTEKNPMTREEVDEKCYSLLLPIMGKQRARDLVNAVWRIDTTDNVRSLRPLLMV
jgi:2-methylcitrate dehydratase PrpD